MDWTGRRLTLLGSLVLALGCSLAPPPPPNARATFDQTIPTCDGEADCKAKWEAAQLWVVHNSGYKIQTATDVLIETYYPSSTDIKLGFRVTKEPLGGGRYRIIVLAVCNSVAGCVPNSWDAAIQFNRAVGAVMP